MKFLSLKDIGAEEREMLNGKIQYVVCKSDVARSELLNTIRRIEKLHLFFIERAKIMKRIDTKS